MGKGHPEVPASHPARGAATQTARAPSCRGRASLRIRGAGGPGAGGTGRGAEEWVGRPPRPAWSQRRRRGQEPWKDGRALFEDLGVNMK